jgi:hypothetical protein
MELRAIQGLAPLFSFFVAPMVESTRSMDINFIKKKKYIYIYIYIYIYHFVRLALLTNTEIIYGT